MEENMKTKKKILTSLLMSGMLLALVTPRIINASAVEEEQDTIKEVETEEAKVSQTMNAVETQVFIAPLVQLNQPSLHHNHCMILYIPHMEQQWIQMVMVLLVSQKQMLIQEKSISSTMDGIER